MLSLIEVECPHCGAKGQIMVPPVGAIIIGPCPQCRELVVVFCGHVLPLNRDVMDSGDMDEKREHLLEILSDFLQDRVSRLIIEDGAFEAAPEEADDEYGGYESARTETLLGERLAEDPISQAELDRFTDVDLKLLDNRAYFNSVFGGGSPL